MTHAKALRPFRQGDLDSLCGVYAILNAIRKCIGDRSITERDWRVFFNHLIGDDRHRNDAADAVTTGIFNRSLWKRAKLACSYTRRFGMEVTVERPFRLKEWSHVDLPSWLAQQASLPSTAVVLGLTIPWDHWTVVQRVGRHYVTFLDSSDCRRVPVARFALHDDGQRAVDEPGSILVFTAS